jgi:dihydropteroate synthase
MGSTVTEHDGRLLARIEDQHMVFEVSFDELEPTDVTLRFYRDDEQVGSIYNDDGTERTMARLTTGREGSDFIGVEVPKSFVAAVLDAAEESGRITDTTAAEGYRKRVLPEEHPG